MRSYSILVNGNSENTNNPMEASTLLRKGIACNVFGKQDELSADLVRSITSFGYTTDAEVKQTKKEGRFYMTFKLNNALPKA